MKIENNIQRFGLIADLRRAFGFRIPIEYPTGPKRPVGIDLLALDEMLSARDPEYIYRECLYQGRRVSLCEYVGEKYGEEIRETLEALL